MPRSVTTNSKKPSDTNVPDARVLLREDPVTGIPTPGRGSPVFGLLTEPRNGAQLVAMVEEAISRSPTRAAAV